MIEIYIGPNGFGKTKNLEKKRNELIENGGVEKIDILFLESEILLSDEVKDTKDETLAMEYILYELLESNNIIKNLKNELQTEINNVINQNAEHFNSMIKEVLETNKQESNQNFITVNQKGIKYKNLVSIENKDFWTKTGSGQRMQLLLHLVKNSSKKYIFLDEPEKYSHPSMLNKTAKIIKQLDEDGKQVFISTHSPKLLQMLDIELSKIHIFNDITYEPKNIKLDSIISDLSSKLSVPINNYDKKYAKYYEIKTCESMIKKIHYKDFLECLFAEKIYMCEGINDKLFLEKYLQDNNKFYEEYSIISTYGKFSMPLFYLYLKA
ncbi:AAA family ATPase [Mesomycoplasma molare]|uniref:ATP-binding protein n=1 Tax=Mesomycoplasma molare TaxID=171288 RepID=A0ABY5TUR8_9BACT|nr:AAA family ATPase [Mesomycoplasma molare]UWD34400.1 ATP-binding protein [Mesomycoplasma molare]